MKKCVTSVPVLMLVFVVLTMIWSVIGYKDTFMGCSKN